MIFPWRTPNVLPLLLIVILTGRIFKNKNAMVRSNFFCESIAVEPFVASLREASCLMCSCLRAEARLPKYTADRRCGAQGEAEESAYAFANFTKWPASAGHCHFPLPRRHMKQLRLKFAQLTG
jgi:hypothetical protein